MPAPILLSNPAWSLGPGDARWPLALRDLRDPPAQLRVAGSLPDFSRAVAVVGTRYANDDALSFARALGRDLARGGAIVVSGGAHGVDAAAHLGALDGDGPTVAVLATGLTHAYPPHHAQLFSKIAQQGALLSEVEPCDGREAGCPGASLPAPAVKRPHGWEFLRRNRLIAALAPSVVIVQAPHRSGALSTARWAKSLKRKVFVVPSAPWDPRGAGSLELLRRGTEICTSAADILSLAPFKLAKASAKASKHRKQSSSDAGLGSTAKAVWSMVRQGACYPDQISAALDMPAAEVQEALLTLLLSGQCRQRADGAYESTS